jgi:hypothetical protein
MSEAFEKFAKAEYIRTGFVWDYDQAKVFFVAGQNQRDEEVERLKEQLQSYVACSFCGESLQREEQTTTKDLVDVIIFQNQALLPCIVTKWSSRICEFGTKGCIANHEGPTSDLQRAERLEEENKDLKRKLFNEGVKNNSDRARVEFLEMKLNDIDTECEEG